MNKNQLTKNLLIVALVIVVGLIIFFLPKESASTHNKTTTQKEETITTTNTQPMTQEQNGLKIETTQEGTGPGAAKGQTVSVHYTGKLTDGKVFDSSIPRGAPFDVTLGENRVIAGWELGLLGMKVGEKRTLTIPPELGYGAQGFPGVIPQNATLIFDVELIAIH